MGAQHVALAQQHGKMAVYAEVLGDAGSSTDYTNVAVHYEKAGNRIEAGRFFLRAGAYVPAMNHLLM